MTLHVLRPALAVAVLTTLGLLCSCGATPGGLVSDPAALLSTEWKSNWIEATPRVIQKLGQNLIVAGDAGSHLQTGYVTWLNQAGELQGAAQVPQCSFYDGCISNDTVCLAGVYHVDDPDRYYNYPQQGLVMSFASDRQLAWATTVDNGGANQGLYHICADGMGNVYALGFGGDETGVYGAVITKLDPHGSVVWQRMCPGPNRPDFRDIAFTNERLYLVGASDQIGSQDIGAVSVALDAEGVVQWTNVLRSPFKGYAARWESVAASGDGKYYVAGYIHPPYSYLETPARKPEQALLACLGAEGKVVWLHAVAIPISDQTAFNIGTRYEQVCWENGTLLATGWRSSDDGPQGRIVALWTAEGALQGNWCQSGSHGWANYLNGNTFISVISGFEPRHRDWFRDSVIFVEPDLTQSSYTLTFIPWDDAVIDRTSAMQALSLGAELPSRPQFYELQQVKLPF